ncbi:MAG TPA: replicative DNA helicase [Thermodesulfobacteriota bacterium]|nr:replicative DNA helicase [Thermodesulfobacteriota bacterium]
MSTAIRRRRRAAARSDAAQPTGAPRPERGLPHSLEAERAVLGGLLLDAEALPRVRELLAPADFYRAAHRLVYEAMVHLFERNEPVDLVSLVRHLESSGALEAAGGAPYLAGLAGGVPTAANVIHYARIVKEKATVRRLIETATDIAARAYAYEGEVEPFLREAEQAIFKISEDRIRATFLSARDAVRSAFRHIERLYERRELVTGVPTGFVDFDRLTAGLQASDLVIIAGRPAMGKTALALNIARYAAVEAGVPVAIFSLEMSKEQIAFRLLGTEARIEFGRLRSGRLARDEWPRLTRAAGVLARAPIYVDDTPALSVTELRAKARRLKGEQKLGLIVVDYLQLLRGRPDVERREQEISEISRSLKALAKELAVPVVALSQLNRQVEARGDRRPQLADLRESGAIEQDADLIAFVYRDEIYHPDTPDKGIAEIIIGKQRNGPTGVVRLAFLDRFTAFESLAREGQG